MIQATIEIRDEGRYDEQRWQLYVNNSPRALLSKKHGNLQLHWQVYGPQHWAEAKATVQGLLELSVLADQLAGEK